MWKWKQKQLEKALVPVVVVVAALAVAATGFGQTRPQRDRGARFWQRPELRRELGLTEDQVEQLKARFYEAAKSKVKLQSQMRLTELELEQLLDAAEPDEGAVAAKARQIGELRSRLYQDRVAEKLALKRILSPEQQEKLRQMAPRAGRRSRGEPPGRSRKAPGGGARDPRRGPPREGGLPQNLENEGR